MAMSYTAKTAEKTAEKTPDAPIDHSDAGVAALEKAASAAELKSDWVDLAKHLDKLRVIYLARVTAEQKTPPAAAAATAVAATPIASASAAAPTTAVTAGSADAGGAAAAPARPASIVAYIKTLKRTGLCYKFMHDLSRALKSFESILAFERSQTPIDKRAESAALSNCGLVHEERNQPEMALQCYEQARKIEETIPDWAGAASTYLNIGMVYRARKEWTKAIEWAEKSIALRKQLNDQAAVAMSYHTLARIHFARSDYAAALTYYELSASIDSAVLGYASIWGATADSTASTDSKTSAAAAAAPATTDVKSTVAVNSKSSEPVNSKSGEPIAASGKTAEPPMNSATAGAGAAGSAVGAASSSAAAVVIPTATIAKATDISAITNATLSLSATLHNMAVVYSKQKQFGRALRCYDRSTQLTSGLSAVAGASASAAANVEEELCTTYHSMAQLLFEQNQYWQCITIYERLLALEIKAGNEPGAAEICLNIGLCYESLIDLDAAAEWHEKGQSMFVASGRGGSSEHLKTCATNLKLIEQRRADAAQLISICGDALRVRAPVTAASAIAANAAGAGAGAAAAASSGDAKKSEFLTALKALEMQNNSLEATMEWCLEDVNAGTKVAAALAKQNAERARWIDAQRSISKWLDVLGPNALTSKLLVSSQSAGPRSAADAKTGGSSAIGSNASGRSSAAPASAVSRSTDMSAGGGDDDDDPELAAAMAASLGK